MSSPALSKEALAKIRSLSDAALVSVYRGTRLRQECAGYGVFMEAIIDELRSRPHIPFDGDSVKGFDATDGFGSLPGRKS